MGDQEPKVIRPEAEQANEFNFDAAMQDWTPQSDVAPAVEVVEHVEEPATQAVPVVEATRIPQTETSVDKTKAHNRMRRAAFAAGAAVAATVALIGAANFISEDKETPTMSAPNDGTDVAPESKQALRDRLQSELLPGFEDNEILIGDEVNFNNNTEERGRNTILNETLESRDDIRNTLNGTQGDAETSKKLRAQLIAAFPNDHESFTAAMKAQEYIPGKQSGYMPIQLTKAATVKGNTYMGSDGKIYFSNRDRHVGANDVYWIFVNKDGTINKDASFRADCGNPDLEIITPRTPETTSTTVRRGSSTTSSSTPRNTTTTRVTSPDKVAVPPTGAHTQPGSGGTPEHGMDPEKDSDDDGYGPGDKEQADTDPDKDGIHNVQDNCDTQAETYNGFQDKDGCPDSPPTTQGSGNTPTTGTQPTSPPQSPSTTAPVNNGTQPPKPTD